MRKQFHGKDVVIKIGDEGLAATRGLSLSVSADAVETTTRDDADHGFTSHMASWKSWSISTDGVFKARATSIRGLFSAFMKGEELPASLEFPDGATYGGNVIITSFDIEASHDDVVTFSSELQGSGGLKVINEGDLSNFSELKLGVEQLVKKEKEE